MTNQLRYFVWLGLALLLWFNYTTWTTDFASAPNGVHTQQAPAPANLAANVPQTPQSAAARPAASPLPSAAPMSAPGPGATLPVAPAPGAATVQVHTDVYDLQISTQGGTLEHVKLLKYAKVKGKSERVVLENPDPATEYLLQTGLTGPAGSLYPTQTAAFTAPQPVYRMGPSGVLLVPLTWSANGITVT